MRYLPYILVILLLWTACVPSTASSQTISETLKAELSALEKELLDLRLQMTALQSRLKASERKLGELQGTLETQSDELTALSREHAVLQVSLKNTRERYEAKLTDYEQTVRKLERARKRNKLLAILGGLVGIGGLLYGVAK